MLWFALLYLKNSLEIRLRCIRLNLLRQNRLFMQYLLCPGIGHLRNCLDVGLLMIVHRISGSLVILGLYFLTQWFRVTSLLSYVHNTIPYFSSRRSRILKIILLVNIKCQSSNPSQKTNPHDQFRPQTPSLLLLLTLPLGNNTSNKKQSHNPLVHNNYLNITMKMRNDIDWYNHL